MSTHREPCNRCGVSVIVSWSHAYELSYFRDIDGTYYCTPCARQFGMMMDDLDD